MRLPLAATASLFAVLALLPACGGGAGQSGTAAAAALCDHAVTEKEALCTAVGVGDTMSVDGFDIRIASAQRWEGSDSLPEIKNSTERAAFAKVDRNAVALELLFTNTKPVKHEVQIGFTLVTPDGERALSGPYNNIRFTEGREGWIQLSDDRAVGPNRTRSAGLVFPVARGEENGALLWIIKQEKRPDPGDPRGRLKTFVVEQAVFDLPAIL